MTLPRDSSTPSRQCTRTVITDAAVIEYIHKVYEKNVLASIMGAKVPPVCKSACQQSCRKCQNTPVTWDCTFAHISVVTTVGTKNCHNTDKSKTAVQCLRMYVDAAST